MTIATNMAGRGTDIKLGPGVNKIPGLCGSADKPVVGAKSDHEMHFYYDDEGTREIPRARWITNISRQ